MRAALASLLVAAVFAGGCTASGPVDSTVKPGSGVALNPSGQPTKEQAGFAAQMAKTGAAMNSQRDRDAAAMAAAKAKAGGQ